MLKKLFSTLNIPVYSIFDPGKENSQDRMYRYMVFDLYISYIPIYDIFDLVKVEYTGYGMLFDQGKKE